MGGILGGGKPKPSQAAIDAERRAAEAEAKAAADAAQATKDDEYRRLKQRGKASTILSNVAADSGRTLLGG